MPRTPPEPPKPFRLDFTPVAQFRRWHGLSQGALATAAGVSRQTIYRTETNRRNPTVAQFVAIARALGTPFYELFSVVEE